MDLLFFASWLIAESPALYRRLPEQEYIVYETKENEKYGTIEITSRKDRVGYWVVYKSDRIIEAVLDTFNFQTLYLNKIIKGRWELSVKKNHRIEVNYRGRKNYYYESEPVYDRHTLDFVLRGFEYHQGFKKRIRVNVPEFMIINADIEVIGEEHITTSQGEFVCWKILLTPRVVFTRKNFYFYVEKSYPYRFVKYMDATGKNYITLKVYQYGG